MKTYSRRVNTSAEEPPTKKRRLEAPAKAEDPVLPKPQLKKSSIQNWFKPIPAPSSSPLPSSDAAEPNSTPPSSPPLDKPDSPVFSKPAKKRRLTTRPALQPIENAAIRPEKSEKSKEANTKLSQMRLDLGQQVYEECSTCHYYYDRSDDTDRKAHDKFHSSHTNNIQPKTEDPKVVLWQQSLDGKHHSIRAISRTSPMALRDGFLDAFSATYQDMGGEGIDDLQLWSEIKDPHDSKGGKVPRYKGYMYLIDRHPVCILLVERIKSAIYFPFKDDVELEEVKSEPRDDCKMSVDRIWTRSSHRRKGYATRLVDIARESFISGLRLGKKDVAFTSTTQDGGRFAKAYCEGVFEGSEYLMTLS